MTHESARWTSPAAVLDAADAGAARQHPRQRGAEFLDKLNKLEAELPGLITKVQGTGLLFSCELATAASSATAPAAPRNGCASAASA